MFALSGPSASTVSSAPTPASPTESRPSRLRGLSYLRNYTQNHLSSHSQQGSSSSNRHSLTRSISYPAQAIESTQDQTSNPSSPSYPVPSSGAEEGDSPKPTKQEAAPVESPHQDTTTESSLSPFERLMARHRTTSIPSSASRRPQAMPSSSFNPEARNNGRANGTSGPSDTKGGLGPSAEPGAGKGLAGLPKDEMPTIKFIPHQDSRAARPSLAFIPTSRTLPHEDCVIRVGRYSERDGNPNPPPNIPSSAPVGFKSKVVSRRHCEFWCSQGQWYIKDVRSSSGTFLNHIRLSQPSAESRPFPVNDGDVVQLGIDFKGGEEMIFRCVKIRIECNRAWQKTLNSFKYVWRL